MSKTLMVQGAASNVGKSLVVAALCRIFKKRGYKVAPFKAQNMSNNSFATSDGGEIGRAQASQAEACGIQPSVLMNPVLLKPSTDKKSQLVVLGKPSRVLSAMEYQHHKMRLVPIIKESLKTLMESHDLVIIEGAGSPAEINLKKQDIVNMSVAKMAESPVILIGDIDKGGVFAQLVGTYELLESEEKKLVKAFLINKFRGDKKVLSSGLRWIEQRTRKKILGVLPFIHRHEIPDEDSVSLDQNQNGRGSNQNKLLIQVIRLPRISNFTDFDALRRESGAQVQYMDRPDRHRLPDLIIIPGSKSTIADLKFLWDSGWADYLQRCRKAGASVVGICGGYQMLGERILDPKKVEASESSCEGLGFLPTVTVFRREKTTAQVKAIHLESGLEIEGYEIHMGCTQGRNGQSSLFKVIERHGMPIEDYDGMMTNGRHSLVMGTYIHGLFDPPKFRRYFLNRIRKNAGLSLSASGDLRVSDPYQRLAEIVEHHIDVRWLEKIVNGK